VTVQVADDDVASAGTATVTVLTAAQGIASAQALVQQLIDAGKLSRLAGTALRVELAVALRQLDLDHPRLGAAVLQGVVQTIDALVRADKISAADAAPLRALVVRIRQSLGARLS
jgi:hypothetical protein